MIINLDSRTESSIVKLFRSKITERVLIAATLLVIFQPFLDLIVKLNIGFDNSRNSIEFVKSSDNLELSDNRY
ncbi:hypothetical protein NIES2100_05440 [Calothrix sp. NIES-2100]|nr:hypothetical protein NIES2100_05440 [Calothrix sp. NIES-2100]